MKYFHAHIYFKPENINFAKILFHTVQDIEFFTKAEFCEKPIGPHPLGMIEAHFREPCYNLVIEWLESNRGPCSTLVHEDTNDDVRDHTDGILWLGPELPIDFGFFELIKTHPELRIHH